MNHPKLQQKKRELRKETLHEKEIFESLMDLLLDLEEEYEKAKEKIAHQASQIRGLEAKVEKLKRNRK